MDELFPSDEDGGQGPDEDSLPREKSFLRENSPEPEEGCLEEPGASPKPGSLRDEVRGETVLLTGAGGTVGQALTRRLIDLRPQRLLLLDTSEHGLVCLKDRIERQGVSSTEEASTVEIGYLLADLRRAPGRKRALRKEPSVVIHAAAYKHVPFLETRPIAAAENNLLATVDWLRDCEQSGAVNQFVFVSTDKATCPTGVMGATKAGAERALRCFRSRARPTGPDGGTDGPMQTTTVRLCNVFGSRGSVVPRYWRRLREGQSLPVTHPDMRRRFIGPDGASEAIMQSLRHEPGTYVPTAGREVKIRQLANRMVEWVHKEGWLPGSADSSANSEKSEPETWIQYTGCRRGERLQEKMLRPDERPVSNVEGGLCRVAIPPDSNRDAPGRSCSWEGLLRKLEGLRSACRAGDEEEAGSRLRLFAETTMDEFPTTTSP